MRNFHRIMLALCMLMCAGFAVADFMTARYAWGVIMIVLFFWNLHSYRRTTQDDF